jgi:hypothetical protein
MSKLDRNLHALAICYRTLGGLIGLMFSLFLIMMFGSLQSVGSVALLGVAFLLLLLLVGAALTLVVFEVASSLQNRERRTFCLVIAWLVCALFPLGTVLGVFTILQLIQPEAERAFAEAGLPHARMGDFQHQEGDMAEE